MAPAAPAGIVALSSKVDDDTRRYHEWVDKCVAEGAALQASHEILTQGLKSLEAAVADADVPRCQVSLQEVAQLAAGLEAAVRESQAHSAALEAQFAERIRQFRALEGSVHRALILFLGLVAAFGYLFPGVDFTGDPAETNKRVGRLIASILLLVASLLMGSELLRRRRVGHVARRLRGIYALRWKSLDMVLHLLEDLMELSGFATAAVGELTAPCGSPEDAERLTELRGALTDTAALLGRLLTAVGPPDAVGPPEAATSSDCPDPTADTK